LVAAGASLTAVTETETVSTSEASRLSVLVIVSWSEPL
jgi:hypothetical protein